MKIPKVVRVTVSLLLIVMVVSYFLFRVFKKLPQIESYFTYIAYTAIANRNMSYDEKMMQLIGPSYLIYKKIGMVTSQNDVVCFQVGMPDIDPSIADYFIYPRRAKKIGEAKTTLDIEIKAKGCTYIVLYKGYPRFDTKTQGIILFNNEKDANDSILGNKSYSPTQTKYFDKIGLLHL